MKTKTIFAAAAVAAAICTVRADDSAAESEWADYEYERMYVGAQGSVLVPQGGARTRRQGGGVARAGYYVDDFLSVEAAASFLEEGAGLSLRGLWHWWGYEKFDPFFTFGAAWWTEGVAGPAAGWGCFWHFDDNWSLRFDAEAMLDVGPDSSIAFAISFGVQYAF